jgi:hypothetical protein
MIRGAAVVHCTNTSDLSTWRFCVRRFDLALPDSVDECLAILSGRGPGTKLLAGGTDLLPQLKNALLRPACVVDLSGVAELRAVQDADGGGLRIGAASTARALELDPRVRSRYPALAESAALVGSVQVRNLATLGGNLCNAAPSADMAPPLLALGSRHAHRQDLRLFQELFPPSGSAAPLNQPRCRRHSPHRPPRPGVFGPGGALRPRPWSGWAVHRRDTAPATWGLSRPRSAFVVGP